MKKNIFSIAIACFIVANVIAQTKLLTLEETMMKQKTTLAPKRVSQLQWIKGTEQFCFTDSSDGSDKLMFGYAGTDKREVMLTLTELNEVIRNNSQDTLAKFPVITWKDANHFKFSNAGRDFVFDKTNKTLDVTTTINLGEGAAHEDAEPTTGAIAFTTDNNLYVNTGNEKITITNDAEKNIVNGQSVHRDEFGISKGTYWSPMGNYLAYYCMDQTMVTDYPVIDFTKQPAQVNLIKYPMAGGKSHQVTLWIYDMKQRKAWQIKTTGDPEQYLTNIAWSPDEKFIYIAILNRDQNDLLLNCYNAQTGDFVKTLFEEKNDKYVHPMHPMLFVKNHPDQFIWQSERDGFNHLYWYDADGKLKKQITKGNFVVTDVEGFDEKGEKIFYTCTAVSPVNRDLYSYNFKAGRTLKLTEANGTHTVTLNDAGTFFIDDFQSTTSSREVLVADAIMEKKTQYILIAPNPLKDYALGAMKIFTIKADDGTDLYCRQYLPVGFDSTKKYPVIVYQYNGPNVQLINNTWNGGGDLWFQYMAERGYIVFSVDGRGTANRGLKFEQATFRHLGKLELLDQLAGVNYLKSLPYVDQNRMGLFGWSYGGFMTTSMMLKYPDVFKVAVAGGPVIDWSYYEVMYTERYMDTPQTNKEGYDEDNLTKYVDQLKGKLMLIHGTSDDVVVWQNSINFLKACVDKGKQVDYFVYPGHPHNVRGKDRVHLFQKITDYFDANLK
ncbi:MAG: DPP IV N-terminal domain-containing protein [Bacteroidia bacterium]